MYNTDAQLKFSRKGYSFFNEIYKSDEFREKYIKKLYRKDIPSVVNIIRNEKHYVQGIIKIDVILVLSNGNTLKIDEKADTRHDTGNCYIPVVSNVKTKEDGWGYHIGTYISYGFFEFEVVNGVRYPTKLLRHYFWMITEDFKNKILRNPDFITKKVNPEKAHYDKNGNYADSLGKIVPEIVIEDVCNGIFPKVKNKKTDYPTFNNWNLKY